MPVEPLKGIAHLWNSRRCHTFVLWDLEWRDCTSVRGMVLAAIVEKGNKGQLLPRGAVARNKAAGSARLSVRPKVANSSRVEDHNPK